jgi:hypothetical protein
MISLVEHLQRRRHDACADDLTDRIRGVGDRFEHAEHRAVALRIGASAAPTLS